MLHPNILQLKQFYASRLGEAVATLVGSTILRVWPNLRGESLVGMGYCTPYIMPYVSQAAPTLAIMPAGQGAAAWPAGVDNRVVLAHDHELPLQNNSVSRVLLIHSIEQSEQITAMMQEIWRVLVPGGKVLAVVPNRMSFWSGSNLSPFGFGRPFNVLQLRSLFAHHQFTVTVSRSALFTPPFLTNLSRRLSYHIEKIGLILWWFLGGVIIMEAEKQIYASISEPVFAKLPKRTAIASAVPTV